MASKRQDKPNKQTLRALESLFIAELNNGLPLKSRAKIYHALCERGLAQPLEINIPGRFRVTVAGYCLTHAGRLLYCASCGKMIQMPNNASEIPVTEQELQDYPAHEYRGNKPWPVLTDPNGVTFSPPPETFLLAYRGSISHGMFVPHNDPNSIDDIDLMGFVFGSEGDYYGLSEWGSRGTKEIKQGAYDVVLYEIRKAVSLLLQGNPNILSMLWNAPHHVLLASDASRRLVANRHLFVGKHVYNAFAGYAHQQMEKMESRDPADLREYLAVTAELKFRGKHPNHIGKQISYPDSISRGEAKDVMNWADDKLLIRLKSFQKKGENIGYMGDKRKHLVLEHGYDAKNAAHLIRLLRMCVEFMRSGELIVQRPDAAELLSIKRGQWKLEDVKRLSAELFAECRSARDASTLPAEPNREAAESLLVQLVREHLSSLDRETSAA